MAEFPNGVTVFDPNKRPFISRVTEMVGYFGERVGRVLTQTADIVGVTATFNFYNYAPTYDYERSNYHLTRAVFYASPVKDPESGRIYGRKMVLGSTLAKPIVNSAAAFAVGKLPEVVSEDEAKDDQKKAINKWLESERDRLFKTVRNGFRDGDAYVYLNPATLKLKTISAGRVTPVFDPIAGEIIGYNITSYIKNDQNNKIDRYVEELRIKGPHRRVLKYTGNDPKNVTVLESSDETEEDIAPLRLTPFHNEKEDDQLYGISEYQNLYALFEQYNNVLENAIKNNIYNSNALPVFEGVKKVGEFMEKNGEKQKDGTYRIKWGPDKVMVIGEGGSAKILGGVANAGEAQIVLNILFWLICQASETPEFVFGTAVQSSKASVSEQMPIVVMKAKRKQNELNKSFATLVECYNFYASKKTDITGVSNWEVEMPFEIKFPPILDDDLKLNIEIVKALSEQGCITDETKLLLLDMGRYVSDFKKEVETARAEMAEKNAASTMFNDAISGQNAEIDGAGAGDQLTPEEQAIADTPAA